MSEGERFECKMSVTSIEVFRRDEWVAQQKPAFHTVGSNPKSIETGPIGSAPGDAPATSVISGYALRSSGGSPALLLIFIIDYPGLIDLTTDEAQIAALRASVTGEVIA